jgi:hypothetical protein
MVSGVLDNYIGLINLQTCVSLWGEALDFLINIMDQFCIDNFLPYPPVAFPLEVFGLFPLAILEFSRLFLGNLWIYDVYAKASHNALPLCGRKSRKQE